MDSLTQIALGAAVGVAVMGRRTTVTRAALWGAVCGTLPDLDALINHGDPVRNMTLHRGESHALFYLLLIAPLIAAAITRIHREGQHFRRWWLAVTLVLITHPLLDVMTIYGTQLGLPFSNYPFGVGSIFIIDPLYTVPLAVGVIAALRWRNPRGLRWNHLGLLLSSLYLVWGVAQQQAVQRVAEKQLQAQGVTVERTLVGPTAFNSLLWRIVVMTPDAYLEGYRSIFDGDAAIEFASYPQHREWYQPLREHDPVRRVAAFSHDFFEMSERDGQIRISDLRMGQAPYYFFTFVVGERDPHGEIQPVFPPVSVGERPQAGPVLRWMWQRLRDPALPLPRVETADVPRSGAGNAAHVRYGRTE